MAEPMEEQESNIKHTEGGELPDASATGQLISRARADVPAFIAYISSRVVLIPALVGGVAAGVGYFLYRQSRNSKPVYRMRKYFKAI